MDPNAKQSLAGLKPDDVENEVREALGELDAAALASTLERSLANFQTGIVLKGRVLRVLGADVIVDIGYKAEGLIRLSEFEDPEGVEVGQEVEVFLEGADDETGIVLLSKRKADRIRGWERVIESHSVGDVVEGRVMRKIKGGLLVDIGVPVFLPASQVDIRRVPDVVDFVGRTIRAEIIKMDREHRSIVLSRRRLLEREREQQKKRLFAELERGQIRRGIVKNITEFGAFIDLGGVDGLLHVTDMSWGRVSDPRDVLAVNQVVDVMVLDFDTGRERISLGLKQLTPNPWTVVQQKYPVGSRVKGVVVNILPYGAFVKLEDGVEGLVHVSEMSWARQVSHASEMVQLNQEVEVVVLDIDEGRHEISLGMKQVEEDPWARVEEKYPPGLRIKGKVRGFTNFGALVVIQEGIGGLLHISDMSWTKKVTHPSQVLSEGQEVEVVVLTVDRERKRISLGLKQLEEDPWLSDIPARYRVGSTAKGKATKLAPFGAFIELEAGLEGLLHISEMAERKVNKPEDVVKVGQEVEVRIINVDPIDRKIGLSMRPAVAKEFAEYKPRKYSAAETRGGATLKDALSAALRDAAVRRTERPEAGGFSPAPPASQDAAGAAEPPPDEHVEQPASPPEADAAAGSLPVSYAGEGETGSEGEPSEAPEDQNNPNAC